MATTSKILIWVARAICILAILFVSMFAFDSFSGERTFWQKAGGFLIHLLPSFILIALLVLAWKRELIGGIILTIIGLGLSPFIYSNNYSMNHSAGKSIGVILMITFPFVLAGIMFIAGHCLKTKRS